MRTVRALSFGNLSDYELLEEYHFKHSPDKPIHRPTQSLLTTSSGFTNFRGLLNWGAFLLLITTGRMALENVLKYGIVVNPSSWLMFILQSHGKYFALILLLCTNLFICSAWLFERAVVLGLIGNRLASIFTKWNLFCVLAFPTGLIVSNDFNPLFSAPVLMVYTVLFLKLWSYADVNRWCRQTLSDQTEANSDAFLTKLAEQHKRDQSAKLKLASSGAESGDNPGVEPPADDANCTGNTLIVPPTTADMADAAASGTVHKRQRSVSPAPPTKSSLLSKRRTASPKPPIRQRHLSGDAENHRPARYSVQCSTEFSSLLDAIDHELHDFHFAPECCEIAINRYISYPNNVTLGNLYYFMFAPTLCYELNYPRTPFIRKPFLLRRLFEVIFLSQLIMCLTQQWMIPTLKNSVAPIAESNFSQVLERCLKLAIPNHLIWLIFFYSSFHSLFNLIGELMRFGDRFFYSDWWNAETVPAFWSKWNIPVHRFARRHIYLPLIDYGLSRPQAGMVVFFVSAVLHEFLISVPLKMPRMWAFLCMFGQMPYAYLVHRLFPHGGAWGNLAVWITLIIGQPLAMLFYFHDYYLAHYGA